MEQTLPIMIKRIFLLYIPLGTTLTFFVLAFAFPTLLAYLLPSKWRKRFIVPFWRPLSSLGVRYFLRAKPQIIIESEIPNGPCLHICNHQSFVDIPLYAMKFHARPLMKNEISRMPFIGAITKASGGICVDRDDMKSRKTALKACFRALEQGDDVLYYPEGTRSPYGIPLPYKDIHKSLLYYAYKKDIPVIPMSIFNTCNVVSSDQIVPNTPIKLFAQNAVYPKNFSDKDEFASHCWDKIHEGHEKMKKDPSFGL